MTTVQAPESTLLIKPMESEAPLQHIAALQEAVGGGSNNQDVLGIASDAPEALDIPALFLAWPNWPTPVTTECHTT